MSYLRDQFEACKGSLPDELREFLEAKLEAAEARAEGAAIARAASAELRDKAINEAIDHFHEVLPGLRPRDYAVKVFGFLRRYYKRYGLKQAPSLRAILAAIDLRAIRPSQSVERYYGSDIRATAPMHYARPTFTSTSAST